MSRVKANYDAVQFENAGRILGVDSETLVLLNNRCFLPADCRNVSQDKKADLLSKWDSFVSRYINLVEACHVLDCSFTDFVELFWGTESITVYSDKKICDNVVLVADIIKIVDNLLSFDLVEPVVGIKSCDIGKLNTEELGFILRPVYYGTSGIHYYNKADVIKLRDELLCDYGYIKRVYKLSLLSLCEAACRGKVACFRKSYERETSKEAKEVREKLNWNPRFHELYGYSKSGIARWNVL